MTLRTASVCALMLLLTGCGSDDEPNRSLGETGGAGGVSGSGGTAGVGGSMAGSAGGGSGGTAGVAGSAGTAGSAGSAGTGGTAGVSSCATVDAATLDQGTWDGRFTISGFGHKYGNAPVVYDMAQDVDGSWVVAGAFDSFGGTSVPPLMRWDGSAWAPARTTWELPAPEDGFSAVAIAGDGALALATNDSFGERDGEVWIDTGSGLASIGSFKGQVRRLAWNNGVLWVAGNFEMAGTPKVEHLALWDGLSWSEPPGGAADGPVYDVTVGNGEVLVAGAFVNVGGVTAQKAAGYDGTQWKAYDFPSAFLVYALRRTAGGELYAGGALGDLGEAGGLAHWDGSAWQTVGGGLAQYATRGVVSDFVAHDGVIDVVGCFNTAGGMQGDAGSVPTRSAARWDGSAWQELNPGGSSVSPWFNQVVCGDEGPSAVWDMGQQRIVQTASGSLLGGSFPGMGGVLSQSIIARDAAGWQPVGSGDLGIGGSVDQMATGGDACGEVYGLGTFSHVSGAPAVGRVIHYTPNGWENLADTIPSDAYCPGLAVSSTGQLAVGCMVFPLVGDAEGKVFTNDSGTLVSAIGNIVLDPLMALAYAPDDTLWISGMGLTGSVSTWDGTSLNTLDGEFDGPVSEFAFADNGDVIVAGAFTHIGSLEANRVARYHEGAWSALGDGMPGQVLALAVSGDTVYASCYDEGNGAYLLGAFDGSTWQELATSGSNLTPDPAFSFNDIRPVPGGGILLAGSADLDDKSGFGLLYYKDGQFRAVGGGLGAISVNTVSLGNQSLWIGGTIYAGGSVTSSVPSVGLAHLELPAN
ncbi:MAG: hypothetical protein H6718_35575 [Polyangiaceae bacterium]|nr:hypothetical protein [Polyangiaceae bacterium]